MDSNVLEKAGKDVRAIKEIIERTTEDFIQLGKIFIVWGLAFLVLFMGVLSAYFLKTRLSEVIASFPVITVMPMILAGGAAFISYYIIKRMKGLHGLTKPLLAVWLAIVTYITIIPAFGYITQIGTILKEFSGYYIENNSVAIQGNVRCIFLSIWILSVCYLHSFSDCYASGFLPG